MSPVLPCWAALIIHMYSNRYSGFETVGATEYVNYMLLQSDPQVHMFVAA